MYRYLFIFVFGIIGLLACKESNSATDKIADITSTGDIVLDQINDVLREQPNNPVVYMDRAKRYSEMEAYDEAIVDLKKAIKLDSLNPKPYHLLSNVYMDYYQSRMAIRTIRGLLDIYPDRVPTLLKLSEFQLILKQYDEALITIDKIAKLDRQNGEAAFMLGMIMKEKGDIRSATNAFRKATEFDSQITDAWIMLGEIFESQKKPLAKTYYENAIKTDTNSISAIHSLAYYLQNNGDMVKAIDLYKSIVLKDKSYEPAYLNIGILLLEQHKYNEALVNFNILTTVNPKSYLAYYFKGVSYEAMKDIKSAKDNYQNALNFKPDYIDAKEALGRL